MKKVLAFFCVLFAVVSNVYASDYLKLYNWGIDDETFDKLTFAEFNEDKEITDTSFINTSDPKITAIKTSYITGVKMYYVFKNNKYIMGIEEDNNLAWKPYMLFPVDEYSHKKYNKNTSLIEHKTKNIRVVKYDDHEKIKFYFFYASKNMKPEEIINLGKYVLSVMK